MNYLGAILRGMVFIFLVTYRYVEAYGMDMFLQWRTHPKQGNEKSVRLLDNQVYDWYAGGPPMVISLFGRSNITIRINCKVEKLAEKYKLKKMVLYDEWFKEPLKINKTKIKFGMPELEGDATYDPLTGFVITYIFPIDKSDYVEEDARYAFTCLCKNSKAELSSSTVEIIDYRKNFKKKFFTIDEMTVNAADPMTLEIYKKDFIVGSYRAPVDVQWFYTDERIKAIDGNTKGIPLFDIEPYDVWPVQLMADGHIHWNFMTKKVAETLQGKRIYNKIGGVVVTKMNFPATIPLTSAKPPVTKLEIIDPKKDEQLIKFTSGVWQPVQVPCAFRAGRGKSKISWKFKNITLKSGYNHNLGLRVLRNYVEFVGPFHSEHLIAKLECKVDWWPESGGHQSATKRWTIEQNYTNIPRLSNELPQYAIVKDGGNVKIECKYTNDVGIKVAANILGSELPNLFYRDGTFAKLLKRIATDYKLKLNASLNQKCCPMNSSKPVIYQAYNLRNNGKGNSSSHSFSCVAKAKDLFMSRKYRRPVFLFRQVVVVVLPKISLETTPSQWECNKCDPCNKTNRFTCSYQVHKEIEISQIRAIFNWTLMVGSDEVAISYDVLDSERLGSNLKVFQIMKEAKKRGFDETKNLTGKLTCSTKLINTWNREVLYANTTSVEINIPYQDCDSSGVPGYVIGIIVLFVILMIAVIVGFVIWKLWSDGRIQRSNAGKPEAMSLKQPDVSAYEHPQEEEEKADMI